jgi:hypothetical protein
MRVLSLGLEVLVLGQFQKVLQKLDLSFGERERVVKQVFVVDTDPQVIQVLTLVFA